jgi:hypothetical protein
MGLVTDQAACIACVSECIVYTWDYQSSVPVWNGIRVQPVLSDEVMTFKSLILCHKLVQEGHPIVSTQPSRYPSRPVLASEGQSDEC